MSQNNSTGRGPFVGKTAIICGASKGIGKETAKSIFQRGGSCLIVARDPASLEQARAEIEAYRDNQDQFVQTAACDTADMQALKSHFDDFIAAHGVPDYLLNIVGYAYPQYAQQISLDEYRKNMDGNYYGQLVPTLLMLPHFIQVQGGHIAFVSSIAGYLGLIGYASYAPSKFALLGLAETLRHELKPHHIDISVLFPPDTDTPGFERENETKPAETSMISAGAGIASAEKTAEKFVQGLLKKRFEIMFGEAILVRWLMRFAPRLFRAYMDHELKRARHKLEKG